MTRGRKAHARHISKVSGFNGRIVRNNTALTRAVVQHLERRCLLTASFGLSGEYFNTKPAVIDGPLINFNSEKIDGKTGQAINFSWGAGQTALPAGISASNFSARWEGLIAVPSSVTADYTFTATVVGKETLWIDNTVVIDGSKIGFHSGANSSAGVTLNAGSVVSIRMDYISDSTQSGQGSNTPSALLSWSAANSSGGAVLFTTTAVPSASVTPLENTLTYAAPATHKVNPTNPPGTVGNWSSSQIGDPVSGATSSSTGSGSATQYQVTSVALDNSASDSGVGMAQHQTTDDSFEYLYQTISGDFTLAAQVTQIAKPVGQTAAIDTGFLGGLMVRNSLSSTSPFVSIANQPNMSVWGPCRQIDSQAKQFGNVAGSQTAFSYLKITRVGDAVAGYWSTDGTNWHAGSAEQLQNAPEAITVGMFSSTRLNGGITTFANVAVTGATSNNNSSFVGNSFGSGNLHVPGSATAAYVDPTSGNLYLAARDEDRGVWTFNSTGSITGFGLDTHFDGNGVVVGDSPHATRFDSAVTADTSLGYTYLAQSGNHYGVQRVNTLGANAGEEMQSDIVTGLAVANGMLYVAANNLVFEYTETATALTFTGRVFEADGAGQMAADNSNHLWIVQNVAGNNTSTRIEKVSIAADATFGTVGTVILFAPANYSNKTVVPHGIAVSPISPFNLYVTDTSELQQVHIYNTSNGTRVGDFGDAYGVYGGTNANQVLPSKLDFPIGVGIDAVGNVYVVNAGAPQQASEGNTVPTADIIRKFTSSQKLLWERDSAFYQDVANPGPPDLSNPAKPTPAYAGGYNYNMSFTSIDPGGEQQMLGPLVEPFLHADDPRLVRTSELDGTGPALSGGTGGIVRTIGSTKYLFELNDNAAMIYRFDPQIPTATIFCGEVLTGDKASPQRFYEWFDKLDGTGHVGTKDASEQFITTTGALHAQFGISIDEQGDLWFADKTSDRIWEYLPSTDGSGAISYPQSNAREWKVPHFNYSSSTLHELDRVVYSATTQTLYITGYAAGPAPSWGLAGDTVDIYRNFDPALTNPLDPTAVLTLSGANYSTGIANGVGGPYSAVTLDSAGHYLFVASRNPPSGVFILDGNTGSLVTQLLPGPLPGVSTNAVDIRDGINATLIPSGPAAGQYFINVEQVQEARSSTFRWTPNQVSQTAPQTRWSDLDIGPPTQVGSAVDLLNGAWTVNAGGADIYNTEEFNFASTIVTGNQQIIAHMPVFSSATDPDITGWTKAGLMMRAGNGNNKPVYAAILATPSHGLQFQYRVATNAAEHSGGTVPTANSSAGAIWVRLIRTGDTITASYSQTVSVPAATDWIAISTVSGFDIGTGTTGLGDSYNVGLAVTAGDASETKLVTIPFTAVSISAPLAHTTTITGGGEAADVTYDDNNQTYTTTATKTSGVIPTQDDIAFASTITNNSSNGTIIAKLDTITYNYSTGTDSTFGLMYRNPYTTNPSAAANFSIKIKPSTGLIVSYRQNDGDPAPPGSTVVNGLSLDVTGPIWLKVERAGTTLKASYSSDGANWILVATQTVNLVNGALAGLASCSGDTTTTATATWSDVSIF